MSDRLDAAELLALERLLESGMSWAQAEKAVKGLRTAGIGGPWTTHGHVVGGVTAPGMGRPNIARCGGPGICAQCSREAAKMKRTQAEGDRNE